MSDRVVIKVGGSLLAEPGAMKTVAEWLAVTAQAGQTRLLIAGGGKTVEAIRRIDAANPLSPAAAHWAAIAVMDANTLLLADWLPNFEIQDQLPTTAGDGILRCGGLLRAVEPHCVGERLRVGWETTSDAIAARVAVLWDARLVLLKHSLLATYSSLGEAAAEGVIDPETPRIAASLESVQLLGVVQPALGIAPR
jgi:aspartokinase-like uncharacterized kinase